MLSSGSQSNDGFIYHGGMSQTVQPGDVTEMKTAPLRLYVRILRAEVIETLLPRCMT